MNTSAKTIQIFLPGGDPQGIRIAEITTRIMQLIEVPRSMLADFLLMEESRQVAVYFLIGKGEDGTSQRFYVGQTGDLKARLSKHHKDKDFWERAFILVSRTNSLTQTHTLFLEWHCIREAMRADRYSSDNGNAGSRPHTPRPLEADCLEIYETGSVLLATLGIPLFDPVARTPKASESGELYYCKGVDAEGKGLFTSEGFVVLKGSVFRKEPLAGQGIREKIHKAGVLEIRDNKLVLKKDHLFATPSGAALAVLGRSANGWTEWKTANGRTLDSIKRQPTLAA